MNGQTVQPGSTLTLEKGTAEITLEGADAPVYLSLKQGYKTIAQMKLGSQVLLSNASYTEPLETALTAKEFALLKKLADNRGNIVTIDALCAALWDGPMVGYENTLMVHIRRLREKIEADPSHPRYLLTVRGLGYRLAREEQA